jgi:hypothetical protein
VHRELSVVVTGAEIVLEPRKGNVCRWKPVPEEWCGIADREDLVHVHTEQSSARNRARLLIESKIVSSVSNKSSCQSKKKKHVSLYKSQHHQVLAILVTLLISLSEFYVLIIFRPYQLAQEIFCLKLLPLIT